MTIHAPGEIEVPRLSLPAAGRGLVLAGLAWGLLAAPSAFAQDPEADIDQDRNDFRGRTGLTVGSGARAFGMGGAFLARADDATAASWNPAGLSYLRRPEVSVSGARERVETSEFVLVEGPANQKTFIEQGRSLGYAPDFLSATYPVSLGSKSGAVQVSFQRVFAFSGTRSIQRQDFDRQFSSEGGFDVLALGTGVRVFGQLRVGVTVNRWLNGYKQMFERSGFRQSTQEAEWSLRGWNYNVGILWSPADNVNLALVGRTPFTGDVELRRAREDLHIDPRLGRREFTTNEHSRDDVEIDFPGAVGAGVSFRPLSQLTVSADYTLTFWSSSKIRNFFTLPRTPLDATPPTPEEEDQFYPLRPYPSLTDTAQANTEQIRVGAEYVFLRGAFRLPVRVGWFQDRQHFFAEGTAPQFHGLTAGLGVGMGPITVDGAFVHESGSTRLPGPGARSSITSRRILLSLIYRRGSSF